MSYTVLARKYRSGTFDELVGQEHIAQTLKKAIGSGRIAHAYLFCGTRGTGKTSTARILARCLNCLASEKPTATPCGKCASCRAIQSGEDMDVVEIDAASNTQVEKTRDVIINNAQYRPAIGRFKIYVIDEVHMLSKASFNALLKTLEEPPEHVKFILATTEPEKVLPTILSRCQRYDFRNIPTREIADHLKSITKQEKIKADEDALLLVAKAGAGSMRDALSLLDRLLSIGEKELTVEMIEQMLGLPRTQLIFDLAQSIGEADISQTLARADKMITSGLAPDTLIASLVDHLRNLLILRACGAESKLVEVPGLSIKDLQAQASNFDPIALTQDITILEELRRQMRTSQAGRALLDATLVRLALADQFNDIGTLLAGGRPTAAPSPSSSAVAVKKKCVDPVTSPVGATLVSPSSETKTGDTSVAPTEDDDDALPAVGRVWDNAGPSLAELLKARQAQSPAPAPALETPPPQPEPPNVEPVASNDLPAMWQRLLEMLEARGPALHSLVSHGKLTAIEDDCAVICYDRKHQTFVKLLDRNGKKDVLREALSQVAGRPVGVRFDVDEASEEMPERESSAAPSATAVAVAARPITRPPVKREAARFPVEPPMPQTAPAVRITPELKESLRNNEPLIKALMDEFGADIVKVEPAENQ